MTQTTTRDDAWHHPLIRRFEQPISRRRLMATAGVGATILTFPAVITTAAAQEATPAVAATGEDDAIALLTRATQAMAALETFAFEVETTRGEGSVMGFALKSVTGEVRRPADFQADVSVEIPFGDITVRAVSVDGTIYFEDPFAQTESGWVTVDTGSDITALLNPDLVILAAVNVLQNAAIDGTEKFDGIDTTAITGEVDFASMLGGTGGATADDQLASQLAEGPTPITIWVDGDDLVHAIEIAGPLLALEGDDVVRLVSFDAFNEPIEIEVPEI